ncbi:hypothetical protein BSKO_05706 [Bryopsis sp. KO-2023]|nr:hypothetical protein BSKO_05706 [Bryopsis sp. KO-2023]
MIEKATDKKFASLTEEENSLASKTIMAKVEESLREFRIAKSSLENRVDDCRSAFEGKLQQVEASVDSKVECLKQLLLSCEDETKSEIKDLNVALSGDEVSKGSCIERIESRLDQLETTFAKVAMDGDKAFNLDPEKAGKKRANTHRRYRIHLRPQQPQETGGTSEESNSLSTEVISDDIYNMFCQSKLF